jgi:uracil-DNA glycosylase
MDTLQTLEKEICTCKACPLSRGRTHAVPGAGSVSAVVMFVGEAPGREEDKTGLPFVGRSGKFLDSMLSSIGKTRAEFFITSSVKCRPPGNRMPEPCELETCRRLWLDRQIKCIRPRLVVCLGGVSVRSLLGEVSLHAAHGTVLERSGQAFFVTYHPSAAMRFTKIREAMLADFKVLRSLMMSFES